MRQLTGERSSFQATAGLINQEVQSEAKRQHPREPSGSIRHRRRAPIAVGLAGKTAASATARPRAIIISAEDPSLPSIRLPGTQRLIGRAVTSVGSRYGTPGPPPMAMSGFAARRVQGTGIRRRARLALLSRLVRINAWTGRWRAGPARENQLER